MLIKKFYGPLEVVSLDNGQNMLWYNKNGEKVFELTDGTYMSVKKNYFYSLINFISPNDAGERSAVTKVLYNYFGELSGRKILDIMTF
jgi:hypothetical protein